MTRIEDLYLDDQNFVPGQGRKALPVYVGKYNELLDYLSDHIPNIFDDSLTMSTGGTATLVNDEDAPGAGEYYGTNHLGEKRWMDFQYSLVPLGTAVRFAGDVNAPGGSRYYGTDAGGTKGWMYFSDSIALTGPTAAFVNDEATPGADRFYGTDTAGTKGWQQQDVFMHVGYADNEDGAGYTATFSPDKRYVSFLSTDSSTALTAGSFTGLWRPIGYPESKKAEYKYIRRLDTKYTGNQQLPFNFQTLGSQAWYHEGTYRRMYFTYFGRVNWSADRPPVEYVTNYLSFYDIDGEYFAEPVNLGVEHADIADAHIHAFPVVSDDGYISVLYEEGFAARGWGGNDGHNSPIIHQRSDNPEDISAFTNNGAVTPGGMSYPHVWKLSNGNIYGMYRGNTHHSVMIHYSDDNGANFKSMAGAANQVTTVATVTNTDSYAYFMQVGSHPDHGLNIVIMDWDHTPDPDTVDNLYFLHSNDGITWENVNSWKGSGAGEFSKNVVTVAAITQAELDANCKVPAGTGTPLGYNFRVGQITSDGRPVLGYLLENIETAFIQNVYLAVWNVNAWEHVDVTNSLWPDEVLYKSEGSVAKIQFIIPYSDTEWDVGVNFVPNGASNYVNDGNIIYSGWLTGELEPSALTGKWFVGQRYFVMPAGAGETGKFGGAATGATINGLGTYTAGVENPVKAVDLGIKVLRTSDTGATWHTVMETETLNTYGLGRGGCYNAHFLGDDKFFFLIGDHTSSNHELPDSTDVMMIYENLYNREV